jgi:hypothetical protein
MLFNIHKVFYSVTTHQYVVNYNNNTTSFERPFDVGSRSTRDVHKLTQILL